MRPCNNHITTKYHHFQSFVENGDVKIKHVDTKEHIKDIFPKPLDPEFFGSPSYKVNVW